MNKLRDLSNLSKLSEAVLDDITAYLNNPEEFTAEYFESVLDAAREVYLISQELLIKEENT